MKATPKFDLTGKRFGHLIALGYVGGAQSAWKCACDCGSLKEVAGGSLRRGQTKSCGCATSELRSRGQRLKGLEGRRFGRLVVIKFAEMRSSESFWLCRCDCGSSAEVRGWMLRDGSTRSCGCLHREAVRADRVAIPSYGAVHTRLRTSRGPASDYDCTDCGGRAEQWSYDHGDAEELVSEIGHPYSADLSRYQPRCCSCHRKFDSLNGGAQC